MNQAFTSQNLFDLHHTLASDFLTTFTYPWEVLPQLEDFIIRLGMTLDPQLFHHPQENVWISKTAEVWDSAFIGAPTIIGHHSQIRHGAFIRGSALIGDNCVVGNSTEIKNAILFDEVQVPHFNYVGDSILGFKSHLGAGVILSNVKSDQSFPVVRNVGNPIPIPFKKCGSFIGDYAEIGSNSVLNPATIIGRNATVYPLSLVRGIVMPNAIYKNASEIIRKH